MKLTTRIAIFAALWLLAGVAFAVFAQGHEPSVIDRLVQFVPYTPLIFAGTVAGSVAYGLNVSWQQRDFYVVVFFWLFVGLFLVHAIITLTRQTKRQFLILSAFQALFLAWCVVWSVYHYVG